MNKLVFAALAAAAILAGCGKHDAKPAPAAAPKAKASAPVAAAAPQAPHVNVLERADTRASAQHALDTAAALVALAPKATDRKSFMTAPVTDAERTAYQAHRAALEAMAQVIGDKNFRDVMMGQRDVQIALPREAQEAYRPMMQRVERDMNLRPFRPGRPGQDNTAGPNRPLQPAAAGAQQR